MAKITSKIPQHRRNDVVNKENYTFISTKQIKNLIIKNYLKLLV